MIQPRQRGERARAVLRDSLLKAEGRASGWVASYTGLYGGFLRKAAEFGLA